MNSRSDLPLVSVAMATYNGEKYLSAQIDSILEQTYKNIEIVIVDDGSKDQTLDIIRRYQEAHPFIHFYQNEANKGITKTFEAAIQRCKGTYIALSDQDDTWVPHKIETLVNAIGDNDAVYSDSLLVDAEGTSLGRKFSSMIKMQSFSNGAPFLLSNTVPGHTILMKKTFADTLYPFPDFVFFDLWISFNAAANNGMAFVDDTLVHYRQHTTNAVGTKLSSNKRVKHTASREYFEKRRILEALYNGPVKDQKTKAILKEMLHLFHRRWSINRSAFFFRNFDDLLACKQKPHYRKVLYCFKMFFKPNY